MPRVLRALVDFFLSRSPYEVAALGICILDLRVARSRPGPPMMRPTLLLCSFSPLPELVLDTRTPMTLGFSYPSTRPPLTVSLNVCPPATHDQFGHDYRTSSIGSFPPCEPTSQFYAELRSIQFSPCDKSHISRGLNSALSFHFLLGKPSTVSGFFSILGVPPLSFFETSFPGPIYVS